MRHLLLKFLSSTAIASVMCLLLASPAAGKPARDAEPVGENAAKPAANDPGPTQAELRRWAAQLDDDLYATRETAQRQLENAGQAALPLVARAAEQGDIEASTRAVNILLKWSSEAANPWRLRSLEALTRLKNRPAEAALATKILERVREEVAMLRLLGAGAKIYHDRGMLVVRGTQMPMKVVIGPDWEGDLKTLQSLDDFRALSTLSFYSAPFDQETFEERVLPLLKGAKQIRVLQIYGMQISDKAVASLKAELPTIDTIDIRDGGARLGVRGSYDALAKHASITQVEPGSAAERAGLKGGDTITHVDGEKVRDFKHLTELIAAHQGGDSATLTIIRGQLPAQRQPTERTEPIVEEVVVKFDRWGEVESAEERASELTIEELRQRARIGPNSISRRR